MNKYNNRNKREISDSYWLYGKHPVLMALNNPKRVVKKILCTPNAEKIIRDNIKPERLKGIEMEILSPDKIEGRLGRREEITHQGIAIEVKVLEQPEMESIVDFNLIVALDKITDPHNIGAIMRSAAAFGAGAVITQENGSPEENATIAKISVGALEVIPYIRVSSLFKRLDELKEYGFKVIGLEGECEKDISEIDKNGKYILVVGSEGKGLSDVIKERCDELVRINITDKIESLNASVAAAVALYSLTGK